MLQLAHQNAANTVDLGIVVGYNDGAAKHAGLVRDVSDSKWKLFNGVTTEPTTTVDFGQGSLDNLAVAGIEATTATIGDVSNTELQYLNGVTSSIQTQLNDKVTLADTGWITISSFTNNFVGGDSPAYRKLNGVVYLRGRVSSGTGGTSAFTLPAGYRPSANFVRPIQVYGTATISWITVSTTGTVTPNGTAAWLTAVDFPV